MAHSLKVNAKLTKKVLQLDNAKAVHRLGLWRCSATADAVCGLCYKWHVKSIPLTLSGASWTFLLSQVFLASFGFLFSIVLSGVLIALAHLCRLNLDFLNWLIDSPNTKLMASLKKCYLNDLCLRNCRFISAVTVSIFGFAVVFSRFFNKNRFL